VGTLAGMIPPSVVLIVFGIIARESIPRLFIAGIIPGLLTALCFSVMIYVRVLHKPELAPPLPPASRSEKLRSLKNVWAALLLAVVVIGGIYAGIFTPTEAGAMGAAGAFLIALFRGRLSFQVLRSVFTETAKTTSVIFIILVGALIFTSYLAVSGTSSAITEGIVGMDVHPRVLLLMYLLLMLVLGLFIDPISVMFLTVPIFMPPLTKLGMDPIWIGVLVTKSLEIGLITPPVGLNAFVLKSVSPGFNFKEIYHGIWWFLQVELVVLGLIFAFPELALWLPNLMYR
jgi:tripartite ATP-independent transporter DctM subunit